MSLEKFVPFHAQNGDEGGVYKNPLPGMYEKMPSITVKPYDETDTASPKLSGNYTTENKRHKALVVLKEFPATDNPHFR